MLNKTPASGRQLCRVGEKGISTSGKQLCRVDEKKTSTSGKQLSGVGDKVAVSGKLPTTVLRAPGSITFVRNRMLYAKASLNARGRVRFGLRHIREWKFICVHVCEVLLC